jgi:ribosomal protein L40E
MKFSKKNKMAMLLLLGIGIAGFILGFISPRITLFNSEAAGWGKPQANIENKQVQLELYDIFFVKYDQDLDLPYTEEEESVNRLTLKILMNISNPFEDTGLIIPRLDVKLGHLMRPVGRLWTTEEFQLNPFDVDPNVVGDSIAKQLEKRNDTGAAGIWTVYLSLYSGADSAINEFISDIFEGNFGPISFDATLELGNYPINVEGIFGELLKLVGLGLGGTETGAITDEPVAEMLAGALGAELDRIVPAVRSDSIFLKQIDIIDELTNDTFTDIRMLTEDVNVSLFTDNVIMDLFNMQGHVLNESVYFGKTEPFQTLYLPNASIGYRNETLWETSQITQIIKNPLHGNMANGDGTYIWEYFDGSGWVSLPIIDDTIDNFFYSNSETWNSSYLSWIDISADWEPTQIYDRFTKDYYFIRCRNGTRDSGLNSVPGAAIKVDIKHARIGNAVIPLTAPENEDNTVFGTGGLQLDDSLILAEEEAIIVYPGINPDHLPDKSAGQVGILQYGEGDFDKYIEDIVFGGSGTTFMDGLIMPEIVNPTQGGIVNALTKFGYDPSTLFFDSDVKLASDPLDAGLIFFNIFTALYTHNISASDLLVASELNIAHLIDVLAEKMVQYSPSAFTHVDMWGGSPSVWEDSDWADDDSIYEWTDQPSFKDAKNYSWYLFGVLGAVAILSVPYNMKNKEDQNKFLTGTDIANAKDLMEDDTGKTVLIGSVSASDSQKMRWELLGGFAAIGIGVLLYQLKEIAFSDFNDAGIYSFLPEILQSLFENSRNLDNNPYSPLVMLLTAFIDFPGIFAWFIPALYVSYLRNKQFSNIKKRRVGWDVFWKGAYMIELVLAIMTLGLGISTLVGNQTLISYFAGGMIFIVFLFITPYFYFAIGIAGLGGFIGSRMALSKPGESEVTFTEEYLAEGDEYVGTSDYDEYAEYEEDEYEEYEDTDRTEIVDFDSQSAVVGMVCKYCWETYPVGTDSCGKCGNTDVSQAIECPKCGNMIPIDAKFCNECGTHL